MKNRIFYFFFLSLLICSSGMAQTVKKVGPTGADYANLNNAFSAINGGLITANIVLKVVGDISVVGAATLNASRGSSNYTSVPIYPTGNDTISATSNTGVKKLSGADNVTIDGRINGPAVKSNEKALTIQHTKA